jgi:hypothetical protein
MIIKPGYAGITYELPDDTIIADLGYGHDPVRGATYYIDRDLEVSADRGGRAAATVPPDKFIPADLSRGIPLPDNSCDFVVASHILEHMGDPVSLCREMERVGKAGYIETPGIVQELCNNKAVHHWFVTKLGGTIYMLRKPKWYQSVEYMVPMYFPVKILLYLFRQTCYHWQGKIDVRVIA